MPNTEQFDQYRHTLIGLTEKADCYVKELAEDPDFKDFIGSAPTEISYSLSILKQNIFPIALFAKMQSGKSTTTAAMADGREITPCGKGGGGLRTSTVSVTIYNDNVQEVTIDGVRTTPVEIKLYSKQELVQCILDAAGGNLEDTNPNTYDLDNPEEREFLKSAVELEIAFYKSMKENNVQENYPVSKLSILREAILILAFYGCDAHKKLVAGDFSTIAGIQPFLKAGEWESKWARLAEVGFDDTVAQFSPEESLHVFINSILVPVKSDFMKKTGTAVTDAPGTMANLRDTMRALQSASEAAIIVFILNGDRQFTEEERNQLQKLRDAGLADKVVFVLNFKDRTPENIREIGLEENILSVLRQEGFNAPHHKNLLYYDAYLAKLAFLGEMIAQGQLDELSETRLFEDVIAKWPKTDANKNKPWYTSATKAWVKLTKKTLNLIDSDELTDEVSDSALTAGNEILKKIRAVSRWDQMIFSLRAHILKNRAAGVLLDLGARPVVKALESIEQTLKRREDITERERADIEENYRSAKKTLDDFSERADDLLRAEFTYRMDKALAGDCYEKVIIGSADNAATKAAPEIYEATSISSNLRSGLSYIGTKVGNLFRKKQNKKVHISIEQRCSDIFSRHYKETVSVKGTSWSANLEYSDVYNDYVRKTVKYVQSTLQQIWKELKLKDNDLLENISPVPSNLTGSISKDVRLNSNLIQNLDTAMAAKFSTLSFVKGMAFFTATALALMPIVAIPIIGQFLGFIMGIMAWIKYLAETDEEEQKKIDELAEKIANDLRGHLGKQTERDKIEDTLINGQVPKYSWEQPKPGIKIIREFYEQLFRATIEQQKNELNAAYKRALAELELNQTERDRIKGKALAFRTNKIALLQKDVTKTEQEIIDIWGGGN